MTLLNNKLKELTSLQKLKTSYPDLEIGTDRWNREYFISKSSASKCNEFSIRRGCGCCHDAPIYISCYLIDEETKNYIYHINPKSYCIGEDSRSGRIEGLDIEEVISKLRNDGIRETLLNKIEEYLKDNQNQEEEEE